MPGIEARPIGVLALQGDFRRHLEAFEAAGIPARPFRDREEIPALSGIVIPGGESTTIGMLMERRGLPAALIEAAKAGLPFLGTCAGAILMATRIEGLTRFSDGSPQLKLGIFPFTVERNAYGSQVDSFEARLDLLDEVDSFKAEIEGVFIRAPRFSMIGEGVRVLASFNGCPVLVRAGNLLACAFHPELTGNPALHEYFAYRICGLPRVGSAMAG